VLPPSIDCPFYAEHEQIKKEHGVEFIIELRWSRWEIYRVLFIRKKKKRELNSDLDII